MKKGRRTEITLATVRSHLRRAKGSKEKAVGKKQIELETDRQAYIDKVSDMSQVDRVKEKNKLIERLNKAERSRNVGGSELAWKLIILNDYV